jgi:histone-lysine N-methyltransferase SETD3
MSIEEERKMLKYLDKLMKAHLDKYPTTIEEDLYILKKENLSLTYNQRNCLLMRIGEKKILHFFSKFSQYCLELFSYNNIYVKYLRYIYI